MAHNTKPILTDVNGKPIPQYFDPLADEYKPLLGQHGASRSILYGPDGQPIGTAGNPLQVQAHDTDAALGQIKDALGPLATETKLEAVRALLAALEGKDFATQATLAQVLTKLNDLATTAKQDAVKVAVDAVKDMLQNGTAKMTVNGSTLALRQTIVTGAKTVVSTAAEIFAGASRLDNRHAMVVTNTGADIVYIGAVGVTTSNGFPIFPQDTLRIEFDPTSSVGVFACTSGPNVQVRVVELA